MCSIKVYVFLVSFVVVCNGMTLETLKSLRQGIIKAERNRRFGSSVELNGAEKLVSDILKRAKKREIESSRVNNTIFPPSLNFFITKHLIEQSKVFKIIKRMPKGGILHLHDMGITSLDWIIKNVTYRDNFYMCFNENGQLLTRFFDKPPKNGDCEWQSAKRLRSQCDDVEQFDKDLHDQFSIITSTPEKDYVTINDVWVKFEHYFGAVSGIFHYEPVFRDYMTQAFKEALEDNVQYLENRALLLPLYTLDGTTYDPEHTLKTYKEVEEDFRRKNPSFIGMKVIQAGIRFNSPKDIETNLRQAIMFRQKYPEIFRGYDLVGQEDRGRILQDYMEQLLYPSQQSPPVDLKYFFHAGETGWNDNLIDLNLIDAILLNTTRIGHGYALHKHPELLELVKAKDIAIELNPISNQVLKLVSDLRNHGAVSLFSNDFPLTVSSDDPGVWGSLPLSHDFYMAYMAMTGEDDGLEVLKQLAINSIKYSTLTFEEKCDAMMKWKAQWKIFINDILEEHMNEVLMDMFKQIYKNYVKKESRKSDFERIMTMFDK